MSEQAGGRGGRWLPPAGPTAPMEGAAGPLDGPTAGPLEEGTVVWFRGGYGFLAREGSDEPTILAHHSTIQMDGYRTLAKGQRVRFRAARGERGERATEVWPG